MLKNNEQEVVGYEVKIYRSLTVPVLIMGLPRNAMIMVGAIFAASVFALHSFYGIPVAFIVYFALRNLCKKDDRAIDIFLRASNHKVFYRA